MFSGRLALLLSLTLVGLVFAPLTARAQTSTDELQVISLTTSVVSKSLGAKAAVHVMKLALDSRYALAEWTAGERTGQEILEKRMGVGWVPLGKGGGQLSTGWLVDYGIPAATATALLAGVKQCPNPQHVIYHGNVTSVCLIGPCGVC